MEVRHNTRRRLLVLVWYLVLQLISTFTGQTKTFFFTHALKDVLQLCITLLLFTQEIHHILGGSEFKTILL